MEDLKQETTMEELNNEIEVVEEEEEVYKPKTEEEKAKEIKYNSDGERLVYIGNDCWVPENAIPTEQDLHEYYARFARPRIYPSAACFCRARSCAKRKSRWGNHAPSRTA